MKWRARFSAAVVATVALLGFSSGSASASAFGSSPINSFEYSNGGVVIKVPAGCIFSHRISGGDRAITHQNAGSDCVGPGYFSGGFCNWRIDFTYEDVDQRQYLVSRGPVHNECVHNTFRNESADRVLPAYGKACARFIVGGAERAAVCHNIVR